jgi:hypothetical protein
VAERNYNTQVDHTLRTHANILAGDDDANDVLQSDQFPAITPEQRSTPPTDPM